MRVRFFYDVVCPFAYLASERVAAMAERVGAQLEWCPVLLGGLYRHHGTDQVPADGWAASKVRLNAVDLQEQADFYNTPFEHNPLHPQRSVEAMRLIVSAPEHVRPSLSHALFRAYWVDGANITDETTLDGLATKHGVDPSLRCTEAVKQELHYRTANAADAGAFGVPTFEVNRRIWWGQDRMHFVEAALGGDPEIEPSLSAEIPSTNRTITFFHDFSSPFSYLASTQVERVAAQRGARVQWRPILLGALFRTIGTPDVPLFSMSPAKMRYVQRDLKDWAEWWGVDFAFPANFPIRSVLALRVALQQPDATGLLYRAAWVEGHDISDPEIVERILDGHGLAGAELVAGAQDDRIKQALRDNTTAAQAAGACGVPTFQVEDTLIWGQDRLHMLAGLLR